MTGKRASLVGLTADEIARACEQNYIDYWRCVGLSPNAEFSEEGGITRCVTGLPQEIFNVVMSCRLSRDSIHKSIDAVVRQFRERRLTLIWHVGKLTEPDNLGDYLAAQGYPHDYDLTAMAVDLDLLDERVDSSEGVSVRTVSSGEDCRRWVECLTRSWESPPEVSSWMHDNACFNIELERERGLSLPRKMYLGLLAGRPTSAAMLFWSENLAGLQTVGTIRSGRGKGVGSAVVGAALADARARGFRYVVVLSTVEGVPLYRKVGFEAFGRLPEHSMDFR